MAQLSIYLDEKTQMKARNAAKRANCSLFLWAREQLSAAADEGTQEFKRIAGLQIED